MNVTLAACGGGTGRSLTAECRDAILAADRVLGSKRLLEDLPACFPEGLPGDRALCRQAVMPGRMAEAVQTLSDDPAVSEVVVLFSGDTGFYSGARALAPALLARGFSVRVLPGVSSIQLLAARLGEPWQDWRLVSAHGVSCNPVTEVMQGRKTCFLTGGNGSAGGPAELCAALTAAGLGGLPAVAAENLDGPDERIRRGTAAEFSTASFSALSLLLTDAAPVEARRTPGLPDSAFRRLDGVPMTKQVIRAAALGKLGVLDTDVVWDIGAGTGSVSVELAHAAARGQVFAVERREDACALIWQNREDHCAWNLSVQRGEAPGALAFLPAPDAAFLGGSGGSLEETIRAVFDANPACRVCIPAITLETLHTAVRVLDEFGQNPQVTQISVSRSKAAGASHLMLAENAVFLVTGNCHD